MKTKHTSILLASLLLIQNTAMAGVLDSPAAQLKGAQPMSIEDLEALVNEAAPEAMAELKVTLKQVEQMAASLRAIQETNDVDPVLNFANKAQVVLIGASAMLIHSHMKSAEKAKYQLQLAAATALLNSLIRHYSDIKNLKPTEIGSFLTKFNQEMTENKMLTPELLEMSNSISEISSQLLAEKSTIDSIVSAMGGSSDIATAALVVLSIAHWVNPKLAKEGEAIVKTMSQKLATSGANMAQQGRVVGVSGGMAGVPDLIGMTLGMDAEKSQVMITTTLNALQAASLKLKAEIQQKQSVK